ncbi:MULTISPECIES: hypothetical protein [unclassified Acinetobacter]|uniref:hypothetical protein n=1 Tax=unclassified Acinetobacter TaxID=196816 RepID=UPI002934CA03|nr:MULTISPECIES: hypothetical protein [unclassified Acinetobacter]WOE31338.1 hypothetical protein QSG84_13575 [Acinetobacter sp. SAAs470]WOE39534.1 hypothetical protein QSG86_07240 [Acinetobacter sp. SAAs474]
MGWNSIAFASLQHHMPAQHHVQHKMVHMVSLSLTTKDLHHKANCQQHLSQTHTVSDGCDVWSAQQHHQHENCQDCSSMLCQNAWPCLDFNAVAIIVSNHLNSHRAVLNSKYLIHPLKGYKRDVLRPPQT